MTRSILIRQVFALVDIALAIVAVLTGLYVAFHFFDAPPATVIGSSGTGAAATKSPEISSVSPRQDYETIMTNGLFGDAGRGGPTPPPPPPAEGEGEAEVEEEQDLTLNLRLVGTSATSGKDPLATAIIEDRDSNTIYTFGLGDTVLENVTLLTVRQREVVLLNARATPSTKERLSMDEEKEMAAAPPQQPNATSPTPPSDGKAQRITLNRNEMMRDLYAGYGDLISKVRPEMYRDANGNVVGVTANNIGEIPLAKKLGLENNDVLQSVNNETIDSEAKLMEMIPKYRNAGSFRIQVLRNGQPKVITYRLE